MEPRDWDKNQTGFLSHNGEYILIMAIHWMENNEALGTGLRERYRAFMIPVPYRWNHYPEFFVIIFLTS